MNEALPILVPALSVVALVANEGFRLWAPDETVAAERALELNRDRVPK